MGKEFKLIISLQNVLFIQRIPIDTRTYFHNLLKYLAF